jgi:hypothetical protein
VSKRRKAREAIEVRLGVIQAAAAAFAKSDYSKTEEFWALCVFLERYVYLGGDGTNEFGPAKTKKAKVLRIVRP